MICLVTDRRRLAGATLDDGGAAVSLDPPPSTPASI